MQRADTRHRNGGSVPPLALLIADWCTEAAKGCTGVQNLAPTGRRSHDRDVTPALLLDLGEVAALLRVSKRTVASMIKDGRLAVMRIGGAVRVRRGDIEALVAGQPASPRFLDRAETKGADASGAT